MRVIVCVKQVPDTNEVKINNETGTLIRDGVKSILNPDDKNALEEALLLKDKFNAQVYVLTMGPNQAIEVLKEAICMGADKAFLLSDRKFAGSDTWASATIISSAIEKIGDYDIIFCGRQAIDGDTAQVGPQIAEFLQIPQVTYVNGLKVKEDNTLEIKRYTEYGDYIYRGKMPILLTAIKSLNTVRYPKVDKILEIYGSKDIDKEIFEIMTNEDIGADESQIGLKGSPTNVFKSFVPVKKKQNEIYEGNDIRKITDEIIIKLSEKNLI